MDHLMSNDNKPTYDPKTLLAIIGVTAAPSFDFGRLRMLIEDGLSGKTMRVSVAPIDGKPTACLINIENRAYTGMYVPGFKSEDYNEAIEVSIAWTDARHELNNTKGTFLIASFKEGEGRSAKLSAAADMTIISSAIAQWIPSTFVYWRTAGMLVSPAAFVQHARALSAEGKLPLLSWVSFNPRKSEYGPSAIYTKGLRPFLDKELAVIRRGDISTILNNVIQISSYLLQSGASFDDGDAIDLPNGEQLFATVNDELIVAADTVVSA